MASGQSGQTDQAIALPSRPANGMQATDTGPFAPVGSPDSTQASVAMDPVASAPSTLAQDLLGTGLAVALIVCALLAIRIRALGAKARALGTEAERLRAERGRLAAEISRLEEGRGREMELRTGRLSEENRSLRRERRALRESHSRLRAQAGRDELTGLLLRRSFEDLLDRELRRALRDNSPVSVVAWTMDESHLLAERLGADQAARILQRVAGALHSACRRGGDNLARIGTHAFAAVLPGTSVGGAARLAERVRESVRSMALPNPGSRAGGRLTVSAGLAEPDPATGPTPDAVLAALDAACTEAARRGGDQLVRVRMQVSTLRRAAG